MWAISLNHSMWNLPQVTKAVDVPKEVTIFLEKLFQKQDYDQQTDAETIQNLLREENFLLHPSAQKCDESMAAVELL